MTGLTDREVRHLLAVTMSYDNRKPSDAAVLAWGEAASRGRWTFEEAVEAVHEHYVRSNEFLMPAHITALVRSRRQDAAMREPVVAPDAVGQARVVGMLSGAFRDVGEPAPGDLAQLHDAVLAVRCPRCQSGPGVRCVNPVSGRPARVPCLARARAVDEVPA